MTKKKFSEPVRTKYLRTLHRKAMVEEKKPVSFKVWCSQNIVPIMVQIDEQEREGFTEKALSLLVAETYD